METHEQPKLANEAEASRIENFNSDLDFGVMDYLTLPQYGDGYFNLSDAATLAALDWWWGEHGEDGDPEFNELISNQQAREAALPMQRTILKALIRSMAQDELEVKIFARVLATSDPVPERTYAHISDIHSCLEKYGLGGGHLIQEARLSDGDDSYDIAASTARRRAAIRIGVSPEPETLPAMAPFAVIEYLRKEVRAKKLQIAHLEHQLNARGGDIKPVAARERATLLTIIAVLCKDAGYDISKAAKTAASLQASADLMGISIGETTIEGHLKKAQVTAADRMR